MTWVGAAPGRLDVMGGIADYSGALVLQTPIEETTTCEAAARTDGRIAISSETRGEPISFDLDRFLPAGDLHEYAIAREFFRSDPEIHWTSYVLGVLLVLIREVGIRPSSGFDLHIRSDVPEGKGVSSSAALEVATARALLAAADRSIDDVQIAALCQRAENHVAGAPCGIMDQMTAACGVRGKLMRLLCQPADLQGHLDLPTGVSVWGIDSGIRHAVTGSDYGSVRAAAFMGFEILRQHAGPDEARFGGYLANVGVSALRERYSDLLPEVMAGAEFLDRYGGISDVVSTVEPGREYRIRACTEHPVFEHERIQRFATLLDGEVSHGRLVTAGELMLESHRGYSNCGLGSSGTDRLVEMVRDLGPQAGLFGARIAGGGSGGTVAVMGFSDSEMMVRGIASTYEKETGRYAQVF